MTDNQASADLVNQAYRTAVFAVFNPGQEQKSAKVTDPNGKQTVAWRKDADGLCSIAMRMPDGKTEYWKQTDVARDAATGFKAAAFERRNADGSTYLENGRSPVTMIAFPGNTNTDQDIHTAKNLTHGERMDAVYNQVDAFVDKTIAGMQARAEAGHHDMGSVTVGTHSMGAMGLGAATRLRENYGFSDDKTSTVLLEPFGAGQTLKELAVREAKNDFGHDDARFVASPALLQAEMDKLSKNVTSIRSENTTIFGGLVTGRNYSDNAMIGQPYLYKDVAKSLLDKTIIERIDDHLAGYMASAMLASKNPLSPAAPQAKITANDAHLVATGDVMWRDFKTASLLAGPLIANTVIQEFNSKAGTATPVDLHETPGTHRDFAGINPQAPAQQKQTMLASNAQQQQIVSR